MFAIVIRWGRCLSVRGVYWLISILAWQLFFLIFREDIHDDANLHEESSVDLMQLFISVSV